MIDGVTHHVTSPIWGPPHLHVNRSLMSTLTWIKEKEVEREIETKEANFHERTSLKFYSGGEKMRNTSGQQGEN